MKQFFNLIYEQNLYGLNDFSAKINKIRLEKNIGLFSKNLFGHFGCVNAVEFSRNAAQFMASGGDDRRVLLWDLEKTFSICYEPFILSAKHNSNIFCLAFDSLTQSIFSSGNDEKVIHHDITKNTIKNIFLYDDAIYSISINPINDYLFCVACEDGQILLTDTRSKETVRISSYTSPFHSVMFHPLEHNYLVSSNTKEGIGIWDIRRPGSCVFRYGADSSSKNSIKNTGFKSFNQNVMCAKFSSNGKYILALYRKKGPELYLSNDYVIKKGHLIQNKESLYNLETGSLSYFLNNPLCSFDYYTYYNSCTMKSGCFAGPNDEFVVSGSDDFNVYMWKIPESVYDIEDYSTNLPAAKTAAVTDPYYILEGHRSIVNQTRYDPIHNVLVSSGVEKIIKVWSPNPIGLSPQLISQAYPSARNLSSLGSDINQLSTVSSDTGFVTDTTALENISIASNTTGEEPTLPLSLSEPSVVNNTATELVFVRPRDTNNIAQRTPQRGDTLIPDSRVIDISFLGPRLLSNTFDQDDSIVEDPGMLIFFDSLLQHELEGWTSEIGSTTSSSSSPVNSINDEDEIHNSPENGQNKNLTSTPKTSFSSDKFKSYLKYDYHVTSDSHENLNPNPLSNQPDDGPSTSSNLSSENQKQIFVKNNKKDTTSCAAKEKESSADTLINFIKRKKNAVEHPNATTNNKRIKNNVSPLHASPPITNNHDGSNCKTVSFDLTEFDDVTTDSKFNNNEPRSRDARLIVQPRDIHINISNNKFKVETKRNIILDADRVNEVYDVSPDANSISRFQNLADAFENQERIEIPTYKNPNDANTLLNQISESNHVTRPIERDKISRHAHKGACPTITNTTTTTTNTLQSVTLLDNLDLVNFYETFYEHFIAHPQPRNICNSMSDNNKTISDKCSLVYSNEQSTLLNRPLLNYVTPSAGTCSRDQKTNKNRRSLASSPSRESNNTTSIGKYIRLNKSTTKKTPKPPIPIQPTSWTNNTNEPSCSDWSLSSSTYRLIPFSTNQNDPSKEENLSKKDIPTTRLIKLIVEKKRKDRKIDEIIRKLEIRRKKRMKPAIVVVNSKNTVRTNHLMSLENRFVPTNLEDDSSCATSDLSDENSEHLYGLDSKRPTAQISRSGISNGMIESTGHVSFDESIAAITSTSDESTFEDARPCDVILNSSSSSDNLHSYSDNRTSSPLPSSNNVVYSLIDNSLSSCYTSSQDSGKADSKRLINTANTISNKSKPAKKFKINISKQEEQINFETDSKICPSLNAPSSEGFEGGNV